jgi:Zn-dependent oligopeptidase
VGRSLPWETTERDIEARQPFAAWGTRAMLAVCYAEKAIYELPESELSVERVLATVREIERRLLLLDEGSPRPILSVPHLISGDFSAYYHAYVLAEMAVFQARSHFLHRDGHLVDNPRIGPELARVWWQPGNSVPFAELIARLTGKPLSAAHLAEHVNDAADERKRKAKEAVARLADIPEREERVDLDATIRIVHSRERVAELGGDFPAFCEEFSRWIDARHAH